MIMLNGCQKCVNRNHELFGRCKYYGQIINYLNQIDDILSSISPIENVKPSSDQYNWINKIEFECKYFKKMKEQQ